MSKLTKEGRIVSSHKIRNLPSSKVTVNSSDGLFHIMERESHKEDIILTLEEAEILAKYITDKIKLYKTFYQKEIKKQTNGQEETLI